MIQLLLMVLLCLVSACKSVETGRPNEEPVTASPAPVTTSTPPSTPSPAPILAPGVTTPPVEVATPTPVVRDVPLVALSWEKVPGAKEWSRFVYQLLRRDLFFEFDTAADANRFCPTYNALTLEQRLTLWSELISAIAKYESDWKPAMRYTETTMGTDPVTGKQVVSEGLLQLSYQDVRSYGSLLRAPACGINWQVDKSLAASSPSKTILDPFINLECGMRILGNQIRKRGKVIVSSGAYWAVIKEGGGYQKISAITAMTRKLPFCN